MHGANSGKYDAPDDALVTDAGKRKEEAGNRKEKGGGVYKRGKIRSM